MSRTTREPTAGDMIGEVVDLLAGATTALLPLFALSVPCAVALGIFLIPLAAAGLVVAVAGAIVAAVLAPPFLLFRSLARRRGSHPGGALRQPGDTRP